MVGAKPAAVARPGHLVDNRHRCMFHIRCIDVDVVLGDLPRAYTAEHVLRHVCGKFGGDTRINTEAT